jgi:biopolymer transport protein ExbD
MSLEFAELHRRHNPEPELVPILDALTCIIFFLMYTTTFMELTSMILPPSAVSVISKADSATDGPPVSPKLFVDIQEQKLVLKLHWNGKAPGNVVKKIDRNKPEQYSRELERTVKDLVADFAKKFPNEKSLQVGIAERGTYQELISIMDGITKSVPDVVLISPDDVKSMSGESNGS